MIEFKNEREINDWIRNFKSRGFSVGFVPTMGALHAGHLSLIEIAKQKTDIVVSSIFVNPTQFNDPKDFEKYPISIEEDKAMLTNEGCDAVFIPSVEEIYPSSKEYNLEVDLGYLAECLEGKHRPGHFEGVMQVVKRLLDIVEPTTLFLGRKDYQQYLVVKKMVETYNLPLKVIQCPIVREKDGLAMSSRNRRLSEEERISSLKLSKALNSIKENWASKLPNEHIEALINSLNDDPLINVEYLEIVNATSLKPIDSWDNEIEVIACIAAQVGNIRLIDNTTIY